MQLPWIVQGGMGAGVSHWPLARAVARAGQLGVVAGTALDVILARRLQAGDAGGHVRRALAHFPVPRCADGILERWFIEGGKPADARFKNLPRFDSPKATEREELIVAGNFAEVFLAREGHDGAVGINYLEKIQFPTLPSLFGAMLAGVSYVLMGAGIPRAIPAILDDLAAGRAVQLPLDVQGAARGSEHLMRFDPAAFCGGEAPTLERPRFLAIVSSVTLATVMARKASGVVDGLVVEGSIAGGHNAPPRGAPQLSADGEPVFGPRDEPDLEAIAALGLPFWLAGSYASPERVRDARALGATGVQVGTAFAFCRESGYEPRLKRRALDAILSGRARVRTDGRASPTGFPFKVFELPGTASDLDVVRERDRVCDLAYLQQAYLRDDGRVGWRCPAEPVEAFVKKGGDPAETEGRKCVCNGLMANIGLAQSRSDGTLEPPLVTSGADLSCVRELLAIHGDAYSATDVLDYLLGTPTPTA